jgi:2-isopropylmalate synthase
VEQAYQHVDPALVGGMSRLVVSELGGKANAGWRVRQLGSVATEGLDPAELSRVVKQLESEGASFEGADASFELLVRRRHEDYVPPFRIVDFTVVVERRNGAAPRAEASVKVEVDGEVLHTAADGNGPVNALDLALRKALGAFYPALDGVHLVDYKVRIVDGDAATAARTRVIIETGHESGTWITAGADANIIAASLAALHDSLEYAVWRLDARPERRDERSAGHATARRTATEPAAEASS